MTPTWRALRPLADAAMRRARRTEQFDWLAHSARRAIGIGRGRWLSRRLRGDFDSRVSTIVVRDGAALLADRERQYSAHERMLEHLTSVADALSARGVEFAVCPIPSAQRYRVVVDETDRERVWMALQTLASRPTHYVAFAEGPPSRHRPLSLHRGRMPESVADATLWRVFRIISDGHGAVVGIEHACEVEFWSRDGRSDAAGGHGAQDRPPTLRAPNPNLVGRTMPPAARTPADVEVGTRRFPSWQPFAAVMSSERPRFPVDAVYTWVDHSDPEWIDRRTRSLDDGSLSTVDATSRWRFTSRDELRYSLRSLDYFAEFIRHVYIVTDGQRPPWLADTSDVTVVDHRDIFDPEAELPTFNSHAIESRLHHIDGLSEHYLYMNDDVFFGRRVLPSVFFEPSGVSKFFLSKAAIPPGPPSRDELSVVSAAKNGRDLLINSHGYAPTRRLKHTPHPQRRSTMFALEAAYPEEFKRMQTNRFRSPHDISAASSLHHHFGYVTGRATPGSIRYLYVDLSGDDLWHLLDEVTNGAWDTFCLNDAAIPPPRLDEVDRTFTAWASRAFPFVSRFELPV